MEGKEPICCKALASPLANQDISQIAGYCHVFIKIFNQKLLWYRKQPKSSKCSLKIIINISLTWHSSAG